MRKKENMTANKTGKYVETAEKYISIIGIFMCLVSVVALILFIVLSAIHIPPDPAFTNDTGYRPGWQIMFWGYGKQIIYGKYEFSTNIPLCIAVLAPIIFTLVFAPMWKKASNKKRFIFSALLAVTLLVVGIVLFNICDVALATASTTLTSSGRAMTEAIKNYPDEYYPSMLTRADAVITTLTGGIMVVNSVLNFKQREQKNMKVEIVESATEKS